MKSGVESRVFEKLAAMTASGVNPSIEAWKGSGGRVMGYTCSFVPEELLIAGGFMPYRIRATGSRSAGRADDYFEAANICSMVRHTFNRILTGECDFLDGAIIGGGCDANRHLLDNWRKSDAKQPFLDTIFFPHASGEPMARYFRDELAATRARMESHFGISITDEKLWEAIRLCNETRRLQRELYALRMSDTPAITGAETVAVMLAGTSMPREQYNADLQQLLGELHGAEIPEARYRARLMVVGPGHDDTSMCDIIEGLGALVVADLTCFGGKVIFGSVAESGPDPLQAIADHQVLDRPFCPKNLGAQPHINKEVLDKVAECRVDGVLGQNFLCCDMWGGSLYILNRELREIGVPMLRIEREYTADSSGQLNTRVQAFIEMIAGGA